MLSAGVGPLTVSQLVSEADEDERREEGDVVTGGVLPDTAGTGTGVTVDRDPERLAADLVAGIWGSMSGVTAP